MKGNSQSVRTDFSLPSLTKLCKTNSGNVVFGSEFIGYYANKNSLVYAYEKIKSKPGNQTLDAIDNKWFARMEKELQQGTYKFKNIRRVYIDKPKGKEKRPLGISSPRDKVVQRALAQALSRVYEPVFLNYSHGFRPGKGCHSALNQVRMQFNHSRWVIESDIRKCFDTIDHETMLKIVQRKINCPKTLNLLHSA